MKRPWEVLAAGYVLGELAAGAGASVPAAAVMLTVCFALYFYGGAGSSGRGKAAGRSGYSGGSRPGRCGAVRLRHSDARPGSARAEGSGRAGKLRTAALLLLPAFLLGMLRMTVELRPIPAFLQSAAAELQPESAGPLPVPASEKNRSFRIDARVIDGKDGGVFA